MIEQLALFDIEPPPEAFCSVCGKKLKKRRDGTRYHARDEGRLCNEIFMQRITAHMHRRQGTLQLVSPPPQGSLGLVPVESISDEEKKSA